MNISPLVLVHPEQHTNASSMPLAYKPTRQQQQKQAIILQRLTHEAISPSDKKNVLVQAVREGDAGGTNYGTKNTRGIGAVQYPSLDRCGGYTVVVRLRPWADARVESRRGRGGVRHWGNELLM
jgi:hypothetical protein